MEPDPMIEVGKIKLPGVPSSPPPFPVIKCCTCGTDYFGHHREIAAKDATIARLTADLSAANARIAELENVRVNHVVVRQELYNEVALLTTQLSAANARIVELDSIVAQLLDDCRLARAALAQPQEGDADAGI